MPLAVVICPKCQEVRYRSRREYQAGEQVNPADFEAVGSQPASTSEESKACVECGATLRSILDTDGRFSRDGRGPLESPRQRYQAALAEGKTVDEAMREVSPQRAGGGELAVKTLFQVQKDEIIKELKEIPPGERWVVLTTHRIVVVDLAGIA